MTSFFALRDALHAQLAAGTCILYGQVLMPPNHPLAVAAQKNSLVTTFHLLEGGTLASVGVDDMVRLESELVSAWTTLPLEVRDRYLEWSPPAPPLSAAWEPGIVRRGPDPARPAKPGAIERTGMFLRKIVPKTQTRRNLSTPRFIVLLSPRASAAFSGASRQTREACERAWLLATAEVVGDNVPARADVASPRMLAYRRLEEVRKRRASYCGLRCIASDVWCWLPVNHAVAIFSVTRRTITDVGTTPRNNVPGLGTCVCVSTAAVRVVVKRLESDAANGTDPASLELVLAEISRLPPGVEGIVGGGTEMALAASVVPVTEQDRNVESDAYDDDEARTWRISRLCRRLGWGGTTPSIRVHPPAV